MRKKQRGVVEVGLSKIGHELWVECEVKPGPFSTERMVRVESDYDNGEWVGFVPIHVLENPIEKGNTRIRVTVIDIQADYIEVRIPGEPLSQRTLLIPPDVLAGDVVEA